MARTKMIQPETKVEPAEVIVTEVPTPFDSAIGTAQFMEVTLEKDVTTENIRTLMNVRATIHHLENLQAEWRKEWR